jgi:CTP:phosphocholine cytidylyltransferase-like protein
MKNRHHIKIDNAVILAAGFSSRFVPICFDMPKGLLLVRGETLIERQIAQLYDVGINDISVVTGAHAKQFDFLHKKYNVRLIFNPDYVIKNNFASIYAAREVLGNTLISSSDLYFTKNVFQSTALDSYYAAVFANGETKERVLTLDTDDKIIATRYGGCDSWITFGGQAFFTYDFSQKLIELIAPVIDNPKYANKYWVDFQDVHLAELPMYIKRLERSDIVEFNTLESLWKFDPSFSSVSASKTVRAILAKLKTDNERELSNFLPIKQNNEAVGCSFEFNKEIYDYITKTDELKIRR